MGKVEVDGLTIQKPPGMRVSTVKKAEVYMSHLYMHGMLTTEQIWRLSGKYESLSEVKRVLQMTPMVKRKNRAVRMYRDREWRTLNRLMVWQLTTEGEYIVERDIYNGSHEWAYSSGKIQRDLTKRRLERILRLAELQAELVASGDAKDFSFWDVAQMLSILGVREDCEEGRAKETNILWQHRPTLAGIVGIGDERIVGISMYDSETLSGLTQYLNRAFPVAFTRLENTDLTVGMALVLTENLYTRCLPVLSKLVGRHANLIVFPYEYAIDHAAAAASILRGDRDSVLQEVILNYEFDGWRVERTNRVPELVGTEFYTYRAIRNESVEYFDTTFGASLAQLYSLFDHERFRVHGSAPGARVLYVTSEREMTGITEFLKKKYPGKIQMSTEFRLLQL